MSNYPPYQNAPVQRRPVPGQAQQAPPLQQQQPQATQQPQYTPPPAQAQPPYQQPVYQQQQYPAQPQYAQQPQQIPQQQPQQQPPHTQYQYGLPPHPANLAPSEQLPPTLPPRPPGGAGPFLAKTYLSFPPPPRSPNRPPVLPPRPQQQQASPLSQQYQAPQQQAYTQPAQPQAQAAPGSYQYNQQAYAQAPVQQPYVQTPVQSQPVQPAYAAPQAYPASAPVYNVTPPAVSPAPSGASGGQPQQHPQPAASPYQQGYYPPPPPLPAQQQQQPQYQTTDPNAANYIPPPPPPPPQGYPQAQPQAQPVYDPYATAAQAEHPAAAPPQYTSPSPGQAVPVPVDQKQPLTETVPAVVPAATPVAPPAAAVPTLPPTTTAPPVDPQQYATSYNYYDAQQAYQVPPPVAAQPAAASPPPQTPANQYQAVSPQTQTETPTTAATVSPSQSTASPVQAVPVTIPPVAVSPQTTGDPMQQMNSMLESMSIAAVGTDGTAPTFTAAPVELPAIAPPVAAPAESRQTPQPALSAVPQSVPQAVPQTAPLVLAPIQAPPVTAPNASQPTAPTETTYVAYHPPTQQTQAQAYPAQPEQVQPYRPPEAQQSASPMPAAQPSALPTVLPAAVPAVLPTVLPPVAPAAQPVPEPAVQPARPEQPAAPQAEARDAYPDSQHTPLNYAEAGYATAGPATSTETRTTDAPTAEPAAVQSSAVPNDNATPADPPFRPVISCIDTPMAFNTWWYTHHEAPEAFICSKCYMDYLYPTQFQNHFSARYYRDGVRRRCRFKVVRITDQILPNAQASGSLQELVSFMNHRLTIPDCKKMDGAKGGQGLKWFKAKNDAIPGMVICEACFFDVACISPFAYNFEPSPPHNNDTETWACDLAVPFIRKEFDERSKISDWDNFCLEAKARLGMIPCPKTYQAAISLRKWFTPVKGQGPPDAVLCAACYCDRILKSGQESVWENMPRDPIFSNKYTQDCCMGQFHILMAISCAEEDKDWPIFWRALNKIAYEEKVCAADGIKDGKWFTLPSQPAGFQVCGACFAGIIESVHLERFFVPKTQDLPASPETPVVCSLNMKAPRFQAQIDKFLETWFTQDPTSWEAFNQRYGNIPPCCRDTDYRNRAWYGWPECTICAECYIDFIKGTKLDDPALMPMNSATILGEARICDMYSPRMRALYKEACDRPQELPTLLAFSLKRRNIYFETMPICRNILVQEKFMANQIAMARLTSITYTGAGNLAAISSNHHDYTYGQAGVGYGFENMQQLEGARYSVQADQMAAQMGGNKILLVGQLETRWRSVE